MVYASAAATDCSYPGKYTVGDLSAELGIKRVVFPSGIRACLRLTMLPWIDRIHPSKATLFTDLIA